MADKAKAKPQEKSSEGRIKSTGGTQFEGERLTIEETLGEDIRVLDFAIMLSNFVDENTGKNKDYAHISVEYKGEKRLIMTGSGAILNALRALDKKSLPLLTKVEKVKTKAGRQTYNLS